MLAKRYTPRTSIMVEHFNGRVPREVLGITLDSHRDLEAVLAGFNTAHNGRRQRVLKGRSPDLVLRDRLKVKPTLAKPVTRPPDPDALPKASRLLRPPRRFRIQTQSHLRACWPALSPQRRGAPRCRTAGAGSRLRRALG
nr:hypothetical protein [Methylobacterium nodulans]